MAKPTQVLRLKKSLTLRSIDDLNRISERLAIDAENSNQNLPAPNLVQHVIRLAESTEPEFLADLDSALRTAHFLKVIRTQRSRLLKEQRESQWSFPEIREAVLALPLKVPIGDGKSVPRGELCYADTTKYLKILDKEEKDKKKANRRRAAITIIRKLWPRSKRAARGLTLGEVDILKTRRVNRGTAPSLSPVIPSRGQKAVAPGSDHSQQSSLPK